MVRQLINQGRERNFRIITPYEAQHNRIEAALKAAALPWEDRCFVLDSFQGGCHQTLVLSRVGS
jgi:superfamily I DNA and/or RNA helicase